MATTGTQRIVSVLIADIADSTAIGERLGPERSKFLFDEVTRLLSGEVKRFGGTIAQLTGDGLYALFGVPTRTTTMLSARCARRSRCRPCWPATRRTCGGVRCRARRSRRREHRTRRAAPRRRCPTRSASTPSATRSTPRRACSPPPAAAGSRSARRPHSRSRERSISSRSAKSSSRASPLRSRSSGSGPNGREEATTSPFVAVGRARACGAR